MFQTCDGHYSFFLLPKHLIGKIRNIIVGFMKTSISCSPTEMIFILRPPAIKGHGWSDESKHFV